MLQKTFTTDFLQKKKKVNEGEVPQYYVENSHPAIVSAEVFDLVQYELKRRKQNGRHTSTASIFSSRLVCGECGAYYGSKVWHSTDEYRTLIWRCNKKYANKGHPCPSPHVRESEIQKAFVQAVNQMLGLKEEILRTCSETLLDLNDTDALEREADRLQAEQDIVYQRISRMVHENAEVAQDQEEYNRRVEPLNVQCESLKAEMLSIKDQIAEKAGRRRKIEAYIRQLREADLLTTFDESMFIGIVDQVTVRKGQDHSEKWLTFRFKDGSEIPVSVTA